MISATRRLGGSATRRQSLLIALVALVSSAVGVVNGFTYDDRYIIQLNRFVHGMHQWWKVFGMSYWPKDWGGDGYRPLTILMFKIESTMGHGSPLPYHAMNILFYATISVLVLLLARRLLPSWAAFVVAAFFAVQPVHVEAVANVVGQSELLVALCALPALLLYLRDRERGDLEPRTIAVMLLLYAVACFSKENGIVLPGLFGMAELTVIRDDRAWGARVRSLRPFYLMLVAVALAFVGIRGHVLADHNFAGFMPFMPFAVLHTTAWQRVLTAIGIVPEWLRLFYWPAHLSSEYGPPEIEIAQGLSISQLPGFLLLAGLLLLAVLWRRRRPTFSFGVAFICVALLPASNFILPAGIVLAERTLFLPSVGALLALGAVLLAARDALAEAGRLDIRLLRAAQTAFALLLIAGAARSTLRTRVWYDNETLFTHAVIDSPQSYRAHYMLGAMYFEKNRRRLGESEYREALQEFPLDPFLAFNLAEQYKLSGSCEPALRLYKLALTIESDFPFGRTASAWCLLNLDRFDEARAATWEALEHGGSVREAHAIWHIMDSVRAAKGGAGARAGAGKMPVSLAGSPSKVPESMQKAAGNQPKPRAN
jgi:tetratricopeptide (TPR) repeat protein